MPVTIPEPDPEALVEGFGCKQKDLDAWLDWAEAQPLAEPRGPEED